MLDAVAQAGYHGIVIAAYGAGHVSDDEAQRIEALVQRLPSGFLTPNASNAPDTRGRSGGCDNIVGQGVAFSAPSTRNIDILMQPRWYGTSILEAALAPIHDPRYLAMAFRRRTSTFRPEAARRRFRCA